MSDRNPFKNLLKRVLKRELVTKHGMRGISARLLQNKQMEKKQTGHCHLSKVDQKKQQQQTVARCQSEQNNEHKPRIRIHKVKSCIELDRTEEKGDKNDKICKKERIKTTKKCSVKQETVKTRHNLLPDSPSSPEKATPQESPDHEVNSDHEKKDLFIQAPNLTPPVHRLRRTRRLSRVVQKTIKFSEE